MPALLKSLEPDAVPLGPEWLAAAFASFREAAETLQHSYGLLQKEVLRLRQELEQANEELARRRALAEMSALLAHEIRNPLGSLELFAGLLAEAQLAGEQREWVRHLQAGLRTLAATVNNVLHFHSQPAAGLAPTDVGELLRSLGEFLGPLAEQAKVRAELEQSLDGVQVAADAHRLRQVVLNLALNALRAMPEGGTLKISGERRGPEGQEKAVIGMEDTGCGIAPEHLELIFRPGFTTLPGSPGLGLAVAETIVQQHGGVIRVSSDLGHGTRFRLEFPVFEAKQGEKP